MSSPVRLPNDSGNPVAAFAVSDLECRVDSSVVPNANLLTAFRFEFVPKPEQPANAVLDIPAGISSKLADSLTFAGSLLMVSDLEARRDHRHHHLARKPSAMGLCRDGCAARALLTPYSDRCLRVQQLRAHLRTPPPLSNGSSSIDTNFTARDSVTHEANVCVAQRILLKKKGKRMKWRSARSREV